MLHLKLLDAPVQTFIEEHLNTNTEDLALKGSPFKDVVIPQILEQIQAKKKCLKKLPTWFGAKKIYYPNKINIEQSSSEITALYKSNLIEGKNLLDLTGGFGVDSFYFSKKTSSVIHCEIDEKLSAVVQHNFKNLKAHNITTIAQNGLEFLEHTTRHFDWIYIDPSRRDTQNNKHFFIEDCTPDVGQNLDLFFAHSNQLMVKLSPMLDIQAALESMRYTKEIHVVAIKNEVKELLFIMLRDFTGEPIIKAVNLDTKQPDFDFKLSHETNTKITYSEPLKFLYEPNASVLKAGAFKRIASEFEIKKMAQHTHLYCSNKIMNNFPGKIYCIQHAIPYQKKKIKRLISGKKANVKTRNFSEPIPRLKKEFDLSDGGDIFIFFTKSEQKKWVLICEKI